MRVSVETWSRRQIFPSESSTGLDTTNPLRVPLGRGRTVLQSLPKDVLHSSLETVTTPRSFSTAKGVPSQVPHPTVWDPLRSAGPCETRGTRWRTREGLRRSGGKGPTRKALEVVPSGPSTVRELWSSVFLVLRSVDPGHLSRTREVPLVDWAVEPVRTGPDPWALDALPADVSRRRSPRVRVLGRARWVRAAGRAAGDFVGFPGGGSSARLGCTTGAARVSAFAGSTPVTRERTLHQLRRGHPAEVHSAVLRLPPRLPPPQEVLPALQGPGFLSGPLRPRLPPVPGPPLSAPKGGAGGPPAPGARG